MKERKEKKILIASSSMFPSMSQQFL